MIFFLSSSSGSISHTSVLIRPILNFLFPAAPEEMLQVYHTYIRKAAHFAEYAVLAILAARALSAPSIRPVRPFVDALVLVVAVASIDEFNQSYDPSRTGSVADVAIDILGGGTALLGILLVRSRRNRSLTSIHRPLV